MNEMLVTVTCFIPITILQQIGAKRGCNKKMIPTPLMVQLLQTSKDAEVEISFGVPNGMIKD